MTIGDALPGVTAVGEVVFDNDRGVEDALRHLSGLGHRRVAVRGGRAPWFARPRR